MFILNYSFKQAAIFKIDSLEKTAILTINDMGLDSYKGGRKEFKNFFR